MSAEQIEALLRELRGLSAAALISLYFDLQKGASDKVPMVALVLRDKGRAGEIALDELSALELCLKHAPDAASVMNVAKAIAALGRAAQVCAPALVEVIRPMRALDDESYLALEGCVWALGYVGGDDARAFMRELAEESPNRVQKTDSIYDGALLSAERKQRWSLTLREVSKLLDGPDPGGWRNTMGAQPTPKTLFDGRNKSNWKLRR